MIFVPDYSEFSGYLSCCGGLKSDICAEVSRGVLVVRSAVTWPAAIYLNLVRGHHQVPPTLQQSPTQRDFQS